MTGIIEWTHGSQCALRGLGRSGLSRPRWDDDLLHGVLFDTDKEYDFFAAIAGARNRFGKAPLIRPRGLPPHRSWMANDYFEAYGGNVVGWLHLSQIDRCIAYVSDGTYSADFDLTCMLDFMRGLVGKLTDPHVRLLFDIKSA